VDAAAVKNKKAILLTRLMHDEHSFAPNNKSRIQHMDSLQLMKHCSDRCPTHCPLGKKCPLTQLPDEFFSAPSNGVVNAEYVDDNGRRYYSIELCLHCHSCWHRTKNCVLEMLKRNGEQKEIQKEAIERKGAPKRTILFPKKRNVDE